MYPVLRATRLSFIISIVNRTRTGKIRRGCKVSLTTNRFQSIISKFSIFKKDILDFETSPQIPGEDQGFQATGGGGRGDRSSQPRQVSTGDILWGGTSLWFVVGHKFRQIWLQRWSCKFLLFVGHKFLFRTLSGPDLFYCGNRRNENTNKAYVKNWLNVVFFQVQSCLLESTERAEVMKALIFKHTRRNKIFSFHFQHQIIIPFHF